VYEFKTEYRQHYTVCQELCCFEQSSVYYMTEVEARWPKDLKKTTDFSVQVTGA